MLINQKQLKKVMVQTQNGQYLGIVTDFELDTENGVIEKYFVKNKNSITGLFEDKLIINKNQIISFSHDKMVVEDSLIKSKIESKVLKGMKKLENSEPVISSDLDS
jgi:sporulation protein YlmC with PRC-barrel domain